MGVLLTTRTHELLGSDAQAMRWDYSSPVTGPRTRAWIFDSSGYSPPGWWGTIPANQGRDVWMLQWFRTDALWPGRVFDGHSETSDTDIQDHAGIPGGGVSAYAVDVLDNVTDSHGPTLTGTMAVLEAEAADHSNVSHFLIRSGQNVGTRIPLVSHLTIGRRGSGNQGALRVWDKGVDPVNPVIDITNVSTCWGNQNVMHFLEGPYHYPPGSAPGTKVTMPSTRFGKTETDAYLDGTAGFEIADQGEVEGAGNSDTSTVVASWNTDDFGGPTGGGGGGGGGGGSTPGMKANLDQDDFNAATLSTAKHKLRQDIGTTYQQADGVLTLTPAAGKVIEIQSQAKVDLTGTRSYIGFKKTGDQADPKYSAWFEFVNTAGEYVGLELKSGQIRAAKQIAGAFAYIGTPVSIPLTTPFFVAISESGGTLTFEYAVSTPSGWATIATAANPLDVTSLERRFGCKVEP